MSFPRYSEYKESNVEWLGDIPAHWKVVPCRAIVNERTAKNDDALCEEYLSLMANVGIIPYAEKGDVGNKKPEDLSKCKIVTRGDFVINSMNYGIGSYGLSEYDGVCSPVYIVLKPNNDVVESRFAFRIFENRAFQSFAQSFGNGILEHRCAINWDILKPIGVGVPPMDEQKTILKFLDCETAKIDQLIVDQHKLIELLKEKRQAVIFNAVTKGLNPDVPFKPSNVEWLGDVPKHWIVQRVKYLTKILRGKFTHRPRHDPAMYDGPYPFIQTGEINQTNRFVGQHHQTLSEAGFNQSKQFPKGTLVMTITGAGTANVAILNFEACFPDSIVGFVPKNGMSLDYLYLLFIAMRQALLETSVTNTQPNLNIERIGALLTVQPPPVEQKEIVCRIEEISASYEALIAEAQRAIDLLQERRTALISAAVTGQIDVRPLLEKEAA